MHKTMQPGGGMNRKSGQPFTAGPKRATSPMWYVGITVGFGAALVLALAGIPSPAGPPAPPSARVPLLPAVDRTSELALGFAELREPVDPATRQRPDYPTTAQLASRLKSVSGWQTAALFVLDATPAELHAAGVEDPDVCMALNPAPMIESFPVLRHWKLVLLDNQQRVIGTTLFEVPALDVEQLATSDDPTDSGPVLERRFPDWPRAKVFRHDAFRAQSDG
jgi:hypothetical protein